MSKKITWWYKKDWQPFKRKWLWYAVYIFIGHDTWIGEHAREKNCQRCNKTWVNPKYFKNNKGGK